MKSTAAFLCAFLLCLSSCGNNPEPSKSEKPAPAPPAPFKINLVALPEVPVPPDNPMTADAVALGKQLFFDTRLSKNGNMSCETCHQPDKGWTDGKPLSEKFVCTKTTFDAPVGFSGGLCQQCRLAFNVEERGLHFVQLLSGSWDVTQPLLPTCANRFAIHRYY